MSVFSNVIKPQGLEPLQFPTKFRSHSGARLFPRLGRVLPANQLAAILATTRVVGMRCPGMNSLYSGLSLKFRGDYGDSGSLASEQGPHVSSPLAYSVQSSVRQFSLVRLQVHSGEVSGSLKCFVRPAAQVQSTFAALRGRVGASEFASQRALVVGGSRGLGEVASKLLAGGGAHVVMTYHRGAVDAESIVTDIQTGGGHARAVPFDVLQTDGQWDAFTATRLPTHMYYFATPQIFVGSRGKFSNKIYRHFSQYYVDGFSALVDGLIRLRAPLCKILYPSSEAVTEMPLHMGEYAAAKAAGETLCDFLGKAHPGLEILVARLPMLATDQTVSVLQIERQDPVPLLLDLLRRM